MRPGLQVPEPAHIQTEVLIGDIDLLSSMWKRDDAIHRPTEVLFGKSTVRRIASIAVFIERHSPQETAGSEHNLAFLSEVITALTYAKLGISKVATPAIWNIDNLLRDLRGISAGRKKLRKPRTDLYVEMMRKGELSLIWQPDEQDFVATDLYDLPYYTGRPINEILHVSDFSRYAHWACSVSTDAWDASMAFHILRTLKDAIDEIAEDASEYCEVRMGANLRLQADISTQRLVRWELISKRAEEERDRAHEVWDIDKGLDAIESQFGMNAEALLAHIDLRRAEKPMPTYEKIERDLRLSDKPTEPLLAATKRIRKSLSRRAELAVLLKGGSYGVKTR